MFRESSVEWEGDWAVGAAHGAEAATPSHQEIDHHLRRIAKQRAGLDAEQARWLRRAEAQDSWRALGYVHALEYLEEVFGYAPRTAQEKLRVAKELGDLPALEAELASGHMPYSIVREFEDAVAVAAALSAEGGIPIDVIGHSYGGRTALGASLRTDAIARVVSYEGSPSPPGTSYHPPGIEERLHERLDAGDGDGALALFMAEVVGLSPEALDSYRANPVWPTRAAAAGTILRELEAELEPAASLDALGAVRQPVLQILGSASLPVFHEATAALDARLADGRVAVIEGARHAAHHTHPDAFVAAVRSFLT